MKKPLHNLSRSLKLLLGTVILLFCFSASSLAQNKIKPIDDAIAIAAPHLPAMAAFNGTGRSFQYENKAYEFDEKPTREWIKNYPSELDKYKAAIQQLIKETNVSALSPGMQSIFTDLKAQYAMMLKMNIAKN
jgi:hypothetical protein